MSVYRDVAHVVARVMSIEANDGTKKSSWQSRYESGFPEERQSSGESLSPEERLTQDSMTRSRLHKELSPAAWHALVAKYSINDVEVAQSVHWLIPRVPGAAHYLFKTKCVTAWAIPQKPGAKDAKTSRRGLPASFYDLSSWDNDGTPESTLRRWRSVTKRWLEDKVDAAFVEAGGILQGRGLIDREAA